MERLRKHYLFNLIGNPADTTIAIANVLFGGLVERFPGLRWCFVHGGGVAPYLVGRWDHGWRMRAVTREMTPDSLPSELLAGFWYDCLVHDPRTLRYLAEIVGWDRIMLGSDCPFDMGCEDPIGFVGAADLPVDVRERVLNANAVGFLRPADP
jgi:aminocarboxymuconate-semialdehyde decarboxylase